MPCLPRSHLSRDAVHETLRGSQLGLFHGKNKKAGCGLVLAVVAVSCGNRLDGARTGSEDT